MLPPIPAFSQRILARLSAVRLPALGLLMAAALVGQAHSQSHWDSRFPGSSPETYLQGPRMVLDWASSAPGPVRFRVLRPDGRFIAMRYGRRSVQGWIASIRVVGWPSGVYLVEAETASGPARSISKFFLP